MIEPQEIRRELTDVSEQLARMKGRAYRSSDEAYAELVQAQTKVNRALQGIANPTSGYQVMGKDLPSTIESLIGNFIARGQAIATDFKAVQFSVTVSGFPPSLSFTLSWST